MKLSFWGDSIVEGIPTISGFRRPFLKYLNPNILSNSNIELVGNRTDEFGLNHDGYPNHYIENLYNKIDDINNLKSDVTIFSCSNNVGTDTISDIVKMNRLIATEILNNGAIPVMLTLAPIVGLNDQVREINSSILTHMPPGSVPIDVSSDLMEAHMADEVHPNEFGYDRMGYRLAKFFNSLGKDFEKTLYHFRNSAKITVGANTNQRDIIIETNEAVKSAAPWLSDAARQIVLSIGLFENGYGRSDGWITDEGVPSYNFGGLTATGNQPYFFHGDRDSQGKPVLRKFRKFNSIEDGFLAFYQTWQKPDILASAQVGDAFKIAQAMYNHHYYTGTTGNDLYRIAKYASAIEQNGHIVASALNEPYAIKGSYHAPPSDTSPSASIAPIIIFSGITLGTLLLATKLA